MKAEVSAKKPLSLALVLGSGGARGLAHIGAIRALEAAGYKIEVISGCSMGALIGGIYALGKLDEYADWVTSLSQSDVFSMLDWTFSRGGIIAGHRIINKLKELVGECDIEDLPIPYTAVAVDIERSREVWLDHGPLFDAIRASIAIPAVFTPHRYRGRILVDGGLLNPVPMAPTLRTLTDLTVVVDVNASPSRALGGGRGRFQLGTTDLETIESRAGLLHKIRGYFGDGEKPSADGGSEGLALSEIMMRSLDLMQAAMTRQQLSVFHPDLVISVPRNACLMYEFHRAAELIELGETYANSALEMLAVY